MSVEIDMDDDDALAIGFEDIKPSAATRLLRSLAMRAARRRKTRDKREEAQVDSDEPDEMLDEMEKNSSLHSEKRGSPAPLNAKEDDFAAGDVRRALKTMPKGSRKKRA